MNRRELLLGVAAAAPQLRLNRIPGRKPRNIVMIVSDDHRYDAMSFMGHRFLRTPALDSIASRGAHLANAFVTTSLCSPSRATILTGLYAHSHRVVDNKSPEPDDLVFFPQYLQAAGYDTAFIGKWHMGADTDSPRRGFSHWVSFRGQGQYLASAGVPLNVNGTHVPQRDYITDELTHYAVEWLRERKEKPFFLMLSHKGVHGPFLPAERHRGIYANVKVAPPKTQADTPENYFGKPRWVKTQRNSTHGVDYPDQSTVPIEENYKRYCETLLAVDESVGRVLAQLQQQGILDSRWCSTSATTAINGASTGFRTSARDSKSPCASRWSRCVPSLSREARRPAGWC
jgi:N-acetylglucosamine-6-sulfatase